MALIPEREQRLARRPEREGFFSRLAGSSPIALLGVRTTVLYANRAASELTGYSAEELVDLAPAELADEESRAAFEGWLKAPRSVSRDPGRLAFWLRHRDGHRLWVEADAGPIDLEGAATLVVTLDDLTDRRNAEERLRESEQWFRVLADTTTTAIFVYDERSFLYVNHATEELVGMSREELFERGPLDLIHPQHRRRAAARIAARLAGDPVPEEPLEIQMQVPAGNRWVETTARAISYRGRVAALGTAIDVTERRLAEEELRETGRRLDLAQRAARYVAWEWKIEDGVLIVDGDPQEIFGLPEGTELDTLERFLEWVHPDDRGRLEEATRAALVGDRDLAIEIRIVLPGGQVRWLGERAMVLRDRSGRGLRMIGVATDITERKETELALRASEQRYRQMFERHRAVKLLIDPEQGRIVDASPSAVRFYGYPIEKMRGMKVSEINTAPPSRILGAIASAVAGECDRFHFHHRLASGEVRAVEIDSCPVEVDGATVLYSIIHDVTERRRAESALEAEKERAQVTLASIGDGVIRTDAEGRIDYLNPVAEKLTGWTLDEARRRRLTEVYQAVDEATRQPLLNPVAACLRGEPWIDLPGYPLLIRRDGAEFSIQDSAAPVRDASGEVTGAVLVFKDVTELRGMEREMSYLASHDPLTGLINRSEFEARLEVCIETARTGRATHALGYVDLDEFKVINDTCGHLAGDELIKQVASLVRSTLRGHDTVARLGGDEFGLLLEGAGTEEGRELCERLLAAVRRFRFVWEGSLFEVGASIGLVPIGADSGDLVQVLSAADAACYVAKEEGRNRIHQYQPDDRALAERHGEMQWIHRIHKAFDERRFCLYQQRILPLGQEGGDNPPLSEIFIRMRAEDGSLATPDAFIPAAERYHLIPSIDRWVVRSAFRTLASRFADDDPADRATLYTINLSGKSLGDEKFLEYVVAELGKTGIDPRRLCFEITETAAIAHLARAIRFISVLKEAGCRFVLDDFGSGLSSFAYLQNLQVAFLKIAGELVRDMAEDPVQRAMVAAIHQVGHVMKLRTIAEGVEDLATLEAAREIGLDYAQGFQVGYPEPL